MGKEQQQQQKIAQCWSTWGTKKPMCTVDLATANVRVRVRVRYSKKKQTNKKKRKKNCLNLRCNSKSESKSKQNKNKNKKLSEIEKKNEIIIQLYSPQEHQQQKIIAKKKYPMGQEQQQQQKIAQCSPWGTKNHPMSWVQCWRQLCLRRKNRQK